MVVATLLVSGAVSVGMEAITPDNRNLPGSPEQGLSSMDPGPSPLQGNSWVNLYPSPKVRFRTAMAYDAESDRVVMFGGSDPGLRGLGETWTYDADANVWVNPNPSPRPAARFSHAMAYDAQSDRIILFGGWTGSLVNDTWAYDVNSNTWMNMNPVVAPSPRAEHAMAYDAAADRIVLFSGWTGSGWDGQTWAYDFEVNMWTNRNPAVTPAGRENHAMVYDPFIDRVLMFGGYASPGYQSQTYSYDYANNTWANRGPPSGPVARAGHAMAYDIGSRRVVLFGGRIASGVAGDTWAYNPAANVWTNMVPAPRPPNRVYAGIAFDAGSDRVVMFGGGNGADGTETPNAETWTYDHDGNAWSRRDPVPKPTARTSPAVYDAQSDRIILFGGWTVTGWGNDTWAYDSDADSWSNMTPATAPVPRYGHALAYDEESDRVILFGGWGASGARNDTWSYDYDSNTWTSMNPAASPPRRELHGMAYDAQSDRIILFGGSGAGPGDDTWTYDYNANTWTNMNPTVRPPTRDGHVLAYDSQSDRTVLYGGIVVGNIQDQVYTWVYDLEANAWERRNPPTNPDQRNGAAMVYITSADRLLLFGGGQFVHGTWAYDVDTDTWVDWRPSPAPGDLSSPAMAYDASSGRVVLFGGWDGDYVADVWWYGFVPTPPTAPQNLGAVAGDAHVNLSWDPPAVVGDPPATGYRIYRGTAPGGETPLTTVGNVSAHTDVGLTNGLRYYYQVAAVTPILEGPRSSEVSATPITIPTEPRSLQATPADSEVTLTWQPPSSDGGAAITAHRIYRGTSPGALALLVGVGDVGTYRDTGLTNGATYYYQVSAVNAAGEGPRSAEVSATPATIPSAPQGLQAGAGDRRVALAWNPPASDGGSPVTGFRIYRGPASGSLSPIADVGPVLSYEDAGLTNGITYYYQVAAANAVGLGPRSLEVSVSPVPPDTTPPTIAIDAPANGTVLTTRLVLVSGIAADDIAVVRVEVSADGVNWTLADGTTGWSATLTIFEGPNTIYARATDAAGNQRLTSVSVTVRSPGTAPESPWGYLVLIVVVAVGAAALALFVRRRRRKRGGPTTRT